MIGVGENFIPEISSKEKSVFKKLKKTFPYLNICIWNTSLFNEFMIHQPNRFYIIIEAEKEALNAVFYNLKELKYHVFIEPSKDLLDKYLPEDKDIFIVKPLITEAPTQNIQGINTTSIEKMLVDIFCEEIVFSSQQGAEMQTIFNIAMDKYTINSNRMIRYANRRGKKDSFNNYINSISNLRQ